VKSQDIKDRRIIDEMCESGITGFRIKQVSAILLQILNLACILPSEESGQTRSFKKPSIPEASLSAS
jgi:hypothetical protein